ncbi:MAG: hypothetical protein RLZZ76_120 [Candidatus Parcubacteria bacterium]|jgi:hypothetical protein
MNLTSSQKRNALIIACGFALCLFGSIWYVQEKTADVLSVVRVQLAKQEKRLGTIAEVTGRDGADAVVEKIIQDCSEEKRARFDTQLGALPTLKGAELVEVEQLFSSCGNFFAERKAVMVSRLEREYEVYRDLLSVLALIDSEGVVESYHADAWGKLVAMEVERSALSTKLVAIQGKIIDDLRANVPVTADTMQVTLVEGQKTKESLITISADIYTLRQSILDI